MSINLKNDYISESRSFYSKSEQFETFIYQLRGCKFLIVVNILVDNAFKYQIILNDKIVLFVTPAFYIFNSPTKSQYNDTKFKELFIN